MIEEIESLGRSEKRTLVSYLENLLMHMLKVKFQKLEKRGTINENKDPITSVFPNPVIAFIK